MRLRSFTAILLGASTLLYACNYDFQQFVSDGGNSGTTSAEGGSETSDGGSAAGGKAAGGTNSGGKTNAAGASAGGSSGGSSAGGKASPGGSSAGGATAGTAGHNSGGAAGSSGGRAAGGSAAGGKSASTGGAQSGGAQNSGTCAGDRLNGVCWYLGDTNQSCSQVCTNHGGVSASATGMVGTASQGGSVVECALVLALLGVRETPNEATRSDGAGLGCHTFPQEPRGMQSFWLSSPDFSPSAHLRGASLACGCAQ